MTELKTLFAKLGLDETNGLYTMSNDFWKNQTAFPNRVKRLIERKILPDAFFCFDNKPLILFFNNPANKEELHKAIWNFNECPIAIIVENGSIEIFNGFNYLKEKASLEKIGGSDKLSDFSYFELVTGRTWEQYNEHLVYKNRIDYHLLENIKAARDLLVTVHELDTKIVNAIIGKSIFVRYLIDRKVKMKFDGKLRTWSNNEFCELLNHPKMVKDLFDYLEDNEKGFNGDLFPLTAAEYKKIKKEDYQVLRRLLNGEDIISGQLSLFQLYDFSIIPIEFISNVYELFIGESNQQAEGAYYTPLFLVDYMLTETVDRKLSQAQSNFSCKVLDPACGSGIFLVETLRKIIEKYIKETGVDTKSEKFKTAIRNLAKDNIFGIDKDLSAVQVAVFSIYLTLLDYLEPPGIETFKFPHLINGNFFNADFFDEKEDFNEGLKSIEFDFIIGNPPWMRGKGELQKPLYVRYVEERRKKEKKESGPQIEIGNKELAQAFLLRSSDFSNDNTRIALIVTSKVLYNLQSIAFRKYFLSYFNIERIFELASVRREVFDKSNDKAIAPACILFYKYKKNGNTDLNIIEHISLKPSRFFSLFKIFTIHRTDYKKIEQGKLKEFDWLFKVLVYGSYLDFNFIKRLKEDYSSVRQEIETNPKLLIGQGVMVGGGDQNDASDLIGKSYIDTRTDIHQYWVNSKNVKKWEYPLVHRVRNKELYKAPVLLITEGVRNDLKSVSAICYYNAVYKSSLTGIKGKGKDSIKILRQISGIINSSFFSYFNLMTFSSSGIEREQSHDEEKLNTPFPIADNSLDDIIENIEELFLKSHDDKNTLIDPTLESSIEKKLREVDNGVFNLFSVSIEERSLLDYANQVSIPIMMRHKKNHLKLFSPIKFGDKYLEQYAALFLSRFKRIVDSDETKFTVEIWHTKQLVGMFFKTIPQAEFTESIVWKDNGNDDFEVISFLTKISSERITDKLFVQKDIRGFEKKYFYIFKPNEKRLWHKAIGYLDVNEFADAIMKAGRAGT
ncbi:MAG TPA: hypothetical protein DCQ50_16140 [Chryseobacterium sp.]|nr:hypothetical protein [Chryseobacterium sp.]